MNNTRQLHRSFIAIFPPKEVINKLLFIQSKLRSFGGHVRWEKEDKFHFTLQFWGDKTEEWLNKVNEELSAYCSHISKFTIRITRTGCFPNKYSPKIFWIGSTPEENIPLEKLVNAITEISEQNGHQPDKKPFHPHITMGRGKARLTGSVGQGKINTDLIQNLETVTFHPLEFRCTELRIIKSILAQSGSTYTTLFTIPLK